MKKLITLIIIIGSAHFATSQMSQGALMTGGNFQLNYQSGNSTSTTNFALAPTAGLFLVENMGIGIRRFQAPHCILVHLLDTIFQGMLLVNLTFQLI
jgi:hypothetical protein